MIMPVLAFGQNRHMHGKMSKADTTKHNMSKGMMHGGMNMQQGMMGMMHGGMGMQGGMMGMMMQRMGMMMQHPMHRTMAMLFTLPYLEEELGLSEEQKKQLEQLKQEFLQQHRSTMQAIQGLRQTLMEKMQDPEASLDDIRASMKTMMDMKLNMHMLALETARKMKQVLTEEQRQKLQAMTPQQWMQAMMRHMPMMEMMQMMKMHQGMMGGGMMMGGMGMQQQGMMHAPGNRSHEHKQ